MEGTGKWTQGLLNTESVPPKFIGENLMLTMVLFGCGTFGR